MTTVLPRGLLGTDRADNSQRGLGILPSIRPNYHPRIARALHALAESNPTPDQYAREKARILQEAKR